MMSVMYSSSPMNFWASILKQFEYQKSIGHKTKVTQRNSDLKYEIGGIFLDEDLGENVDITGSIERISEYLILRQVSIPKPEEVRYYLRQYPDIIDLLDFVCDKTRNRFGLPTQISLELYRDPEIDDQYLTIYVRQKEYEKDIISKIEEIRSIYCDELADKSGYFLLTTDYQFPK